MRRRTLLKATAAAAAAATGGLVFSRRARAFGENPSGSDGSLVPESLRAFNVLEIFLFGGVSQYESFHVVEEHGQSASTHWHLFQAEVQQAIDSCGYVMSDMLEPFALDSNGAAVKLGPFVHPLRQRPDVLARTRLITTTHDSLPHEAAVPLMLTGRAVSEANVAGLGAHIQQHFQQFEPQDLPHAYVMLPPSQLQVELARVALARGPHPGRARPLSLQISTGTENLPTLLARESLQGRESAYDALVAKRVKRYEDRLRWQGKEALPAAALGQLRDAASTVASSAALRELLTEESLLTPISATSCAETNEAEVVRPGLRLAAQLLNHPDAPARYVNVVDGGFQLDVADAGGYDTHNYAVATQAQNLHNVLTELASLIKAPNEEPSPDKIDLDRTMIVLSTEFGRTPFEEGMLGRGHWPYAYPTVFMGGPVQSTISQLGMENGGIFGATGEDGQALEAATPAQIRIAILMSLGIWPFENESFNVSDVTDAGNELLAAKIVRDGIIGVQS